MRTTINLSDELLVQVKKLAAASRTTVTALIEGALREALGKRRRRRQHEPVKLKTYGKLGLLPGVDLDNTDALLDQWITTDRDYARFPGLHWRHPLQ